MKISANDIRVGNIIEVNGKDLVVLKTAHTQPGKGGAYIQVEAKNISNNSKENHRFRSSEHIEKVRLDEEKHQYLYTEGEMMVVMNLETFEQKFIDISLLKNNPLMLQESIELTVESKDGEVISASLPPSMIFSVKEADAVVKGQTATSSYKPAILDNGVKIMVPQFIETGDKIVVDTQELKYIERSK